MKRKPKIIIAISAVLSALIILTMLPTFGLSSPAIKTVSTTSFWALSCTWGALTTAVGGVKALIYMKNGFEPKFFNGYIYFENVREQGSDNFGPFIFLGENAEYYTIYHEAGHGLQNILMGPLHVAVVGISSEIWYRKFIKEYAAELASGTWDPDERRKAYDRNPIERWATSWGAKAYGLELG